ncbi:MAG TPA: carboxypeptidase regulatory-like domain-containing protein [Thermoanaerobaculia bacterium]|jgi:plastocyanin|nr:carboxypeptidase regulatory-like domain-containing protein [Thermoanaerobaculia bacterium]
MSRNRFWLLLALCCALALLVACGGGSDEGSSEGEETPQASSDAPAASAPAVDTANAGSVKGTVTYDGPDEDTPIAMNADPTCLSLHTTPVDTGMYQVKDGKLGDVFVYVKTGLEGKSFPTPTEKKELDQQGCLYHPKVFGIQVGQPLTIKNSDATLHNIHAMPAANTEFNQGQPIQNMSFDKTFDKPEIGLHFKCDVHPWMSAYANVVTNPYYAVSGEDGTFTIDKLPAGTYTLEAWHQKLGTATQQVTVAPGQAADVTFAFHKAGA